MRPREDRGIALSDYFQMLWERRWLIVGVVGLVSAAAFLTRPAAPQAFYRAQTSLRVQVLSVTGSGTSVGSTSVPPSEVESARNPEVASQTATDLGAGDDGVGILERLEVSTVEGTDLLQLALVGRGAGTVVELQKYAEHYVKYRNKLDEDRLARVLDEVESRLATVQSRLRSLGGEAGRLSSAGRPIPLDLQTQIEATTSIYKKFLEFQQQIQLDSPLAGNTVQQLGSPIAQRLGGIPTRTLRLAAGPIVGLILGCAFAIALGVLRPRISSRERAEERLGYPVLAMIPLVKVHGLARDPLLIQRSSPWGVEGVRMLQTELQLVEKRGARVKTVVIASAEQGDGRTAIAVNLAASYAAAGRSVALLRADRVAEIDDEPRSRAVDGPLETIQVRIHRDGFAEVVPRVVRAKNQPGLVGDALTAVLEDLANDFDVVVVDTRPLSGSADSLLLSGQADAVVIVLRQHETSESRAIESVDILDRHNVKIVGVVLNAVRTPLVERYRARSAAAAQEQMADLRENVARQARTRMAPSAEPEPPAESMRWTPTQPARSSEPRPGSDPRTPEPRSQQQPPAAPPTNGESREREATPFRPAGPAPTKN
jgi:Mrp family chromosome partitioning ATPase